MAPRRPGDTSALVVDDNQANALALSAALQCAGMNVTAVSTGPLAIATIAHRPDIDVVLMDIMMPGMDGYETIAAIRRRPESADLPIIAVTGKDPDGERERCLAAGATDYMPKPIDKEQLLAAVNAYVGTVPV
jgi:two-component system, chemotaxis family, sensor kinase CheA